MWVLGERSENELDAGLTAWWINGHVLPVHVVVPAGNRGLGIAAHAGVSVSD
jgi:hypothetical protein